MQPPDLFCRRYCLYPYFLRGEMAEGKQAGAMPYVALYFVFKRSIRFVRNGPMGLVLNPPAKQVVV